MITMPITHHTRSREWNRILKMAQNNGFPKHIAHELKERLVRNKTDYTRTPPTTAKQQMGQFQVPQPLRI
jgi:hypothetical protein